MEDLRSFLKNGALNLSKMEFIEEDFEQDMEVEDSAEESVVDHSIDIVAEEIANEDVEDESVFTEMDSDALFETSKDISEEAFVTSDSSFESLGEAFDSLDEQEWADEMSQYEDETTTFASNFETAESPLPHIPEPSTPIASFESKSTVASTLIQPTDFQPSSVQRTNSNADKPLQFQFDEQNLDSARIKVIGIGGGGGNAINYMIEKGLDSVEYVALNTDAQALKTNKAKIKIQVGSSLTGGLGAGARPEVGREAVEENRHEIEEAIEGADMVFITAGMGGGTGTGGAPIVSSIAKRKGILTVGIVTTPFDFEGRVRMQYAAEGIMEMRAHCDTLIVIPNERLWELAEEVTSMVDSFAQANDVLYNATRGISDLILLPGLINLDFADVRTTMTAGGAAIMGSASATGPERAEIAAHEAINSPLLDGVSIRGARNVLVNISSSKSLGMQEFALANSIIKNEAGENAEIIMGTVIDESFGDELRITVIATGFEFQEGSFQVKSKQMGSPTLQMPSQQHQSHSTSHLGSPSMRSSFAAQSAHSSTQHSAQPTSRPVQNNTESTMDGFAVKSSVPATHTDPMQMDRRLEKDSTDFYKGEQNLKILDAPAIHRRTLRHSMGQTQADDDIRPAQSPDENSSGAGPTTSAQSGSTKYPNWQPKQKIDKSDSEQPAFLRRIMD